MEIIKPVDLTNKWEQSRLAKLWGQAGFSLETLDEAYVIEINNSWIACAGRSGVTLVGFYVEAEWREAGFVGGLLGALLTSPHLPPTGYQYLLTKPEVTEYFLHYGFEPIARSERSVLLYRGIPIRQRLEKVYPKEEGGGNVALVMNANPMTKGHEHLIQTALHYGNKLFIFIVQADYSEIPFRDRLELVRQSVLDNPRIVVLGSSDLIVSRATFPSYFLKEQSAVVLEHAAIDASLFRDYIAGHFGIGYRLIGREDHDWTTRQYNVALKQLLPPSVEVIEIPRLAVNQAIISASRVRASWKADNLEDVSHYINTKVYQYLSDHPYVPKQEV